MDNIKEEIEDKVIDLINKGSGGRLIIFKPEKGDKDLVVEKKGDYKKQPIYINVFEKKHFSQDKISVAQENFYLMLVDFNMVKQDIEEGISFMMSDGSEKISINKKDVGSFLLGKLESENK